MDALLVSREAVTEKTVFKQSSYASSKFSLTRSYKKVLLAKMLVACKPGQDDIGASVYGSLTSFCSLSQSS